jgi:phenolic acid decarboxylase
MPDDRIIDSLTGKTLCWTLADGPMAGKTYEHKFNADGTIEYRGVDGGVRGKPSRSRKAGTAKIEDQVFAMSYLGDSGYTLSVVLNFSTKKLVGFASNDKEWFQQHGTFDVVE